MSEADPADGAPDILASMDLEPEVYYHSSESMYELEDGEAGLVVTSPPYPMISMWDSLFSSWLDDVSVAQIENEPESAYQHMHDGLERIWRECYRVLCDGGILAINIGDATRSVGGSFQCYPNHATITERCREIGFQSLIPIHWVKPSNSPNSFLGSGMLPTNAYVTQETEYILLLRKGGTRDFEPHHTLRYASTYEKEERDTWFSQTWRINGAPGASEYAVFPEEIPRRLIQMYSIKGDTVVDPFLGTGTTLAVADELQRKGVGYEIDDELAEEIAHKL